MVECQLPKLKVASSTLVARSRNYCGWFVAEIEGELGNEMTKQEKGFSRRQMLEMTVGLSGLAMTGGVGSVFAHDAKRTPGRMLTIDAKPEPIAIDAAKTAVIVVDMQNDFGSKGGMFDRAGIDISGIQKAIGPTAKVLASAREAGIKIVYLKMAFRPDLSDLGFPDSPNRLRHLPFGVGKAIRALTVEKVGF